MKQRLPNMRDYCDTDEAEAARLLRSLPPANPSDAMERRVYANICARTTRGQRWMRTAVLASGLLISTAILGATLARGWLASPEQRAPTLAAPPLPAVQPLPAGQATRTTADSMPTPSVAPVRGAGSAARISSARDRPRGRLAVASKGGDAVDKASALDGTPAAPPPEEAALVMAALRSLRREHNPVQAGVLLQRYLTRFPEGVLIEEALAIGIEAATARHDDSSATALANQYLGRYPTGRFVALARNTVSGRP